MITGAELDIVPAFGWQGGPEFNTLVKERKGGRERRRQLWQYAKHRYRLPFLNIKNDDYLLGLKSAFLAAGGMTESFLVKDWSDFQVDNAIFAAGDGAETEFDLLLPYVFGSGSYSRRVLYPVDPVFYVDGVLVAATFDSEIGKVVFDVAPGVGDVLSWSGEHRVPVRFASDVFPMSIDNRSGQQYVMNGSVELLEVWE